MKSNRRMLVILATCRSGNDDVMLYALADATDRQTTRPLLSDPSRNLAHQYTYLIGLPNWPCPSTSSLLTDSSASVFTSSESSLLLSPPLGSTLERTLSPLPICFQYLFVYRSVRLHTTSPFFSFHAVPLYEMHVIDHLCSYITPVIHL
jgi:hypothetical protein